MVTPTTNNVLKMLRKLPPREQLKVISLALPEIEKKLGQKARPRKSLRGLWQGVNVANRDIAEIRKNMSKNFPRSDI
ncbi:MAG: hypothetical protein AB1509_18250 [Chloroflexota bacterium]